ncbi:conjugative transfer signal peptidase TraF (plasmid) [Agrobacterium tumefaciens]|uniref:conjugative transfer signal peptidase TraF n=1 Tax=Agrobacterium tumefaciens TaxID=358 RepID=UPI0015736A09|nr:conjugative transfer signal peptidase TraF [Agrobacterium tumefaciens]NSZ66487.1 conjugative transfer signal peptidase TraF [Agrobacterium tumefaciens]NTA72859.1 conjugative transfer signal peptidase TraF [Agrobacterium tumefaciens]WIE41408.1 conjugative transfer signal peptidase TraF [Agrobacterium tumefaciens]
MRKRRVLLFLTGAAVIISTLAAAAFTGGYRLNLTPSEPLGLWRIEKLQRPVAIGDLVFLCPPTTAVFAEAWRRGYLRRGLCPDGLAPLVKTVAALPGQRVDISDHVHIDGRSVPASSLRAADGEGRALMSDPGGVVPPHHLFLHSSFASSYDSRYFGPVPDSGLLGLARPVFTFHP